MTSHRQLEAKRARRRHRLMLRLSRRGPTNSLTRTRANRRKLRDWRRSRKAKGKLTEIGVERFESFYAAVRKHNGQRRATVKREREQRAKWRQEPLQRPLTYKVVRAAEGPGRAEQRRLTRPWRARKKFPQSAGKDVEPPFGL